MVGQTDCGVFIGDNRFTDLDFANDAVIFAEILTSLPQALEALSKEAGPLGLEVSWVKTKIQEFERLLDDAQSISLEGQSVEFVSRFTYLGSDIHVRDGSGPEVVRRLGRAGAAMDALDKGVWRSRFLCKATKLRVYRALVLPVLLYGCETWTLTKTLRNRLNAFGTRSLRRILGYRWSDLKRNDELLQETGSRSVTCIIRERQLRLFGHVARFPVSDPAYRILFSEIPSCWRRPRGRPRANWLKQIDESLPKVKTNWALACTLDC